MSNITTQGIVLRYADYRENDRMLTLLTPFSGRADALARGCRRPGSPLMSCAELFSYGEYVLYQGKGRAGVQSFSLIDSFYPLREDYDRLRYASYMLQILEAQAIPGDRTDKLFQLLIRSLKRLCYLPLHPRAVTAAFLLMDAALSGYRPRLSHCVRCGKRLSETEARLFDIEEGGLCCSDCATRDLPAVPVSAREIVWMKDILQNGIEKTARPPEDAPLPLLRKYVETRLEVSPPSGKGLL